LQGALGDIVMLMKNKSMPKNYDGARIQKIPKGISGLPPWKRRRKRFSIKAEARRIILTSSSIEGAYTYSRYTPAKKH
jgi:hypothetical protein